MLVWMLSCVALRVGSHVNVYKHIQVAARAMGRHASGLVKAATTISCLGGKLCVYIVDGTDGVRVTIDRVTHTYDAHTQPAPPT